MADEYESYRGTLMPANPDRNRLLDLMAEDNVGREPPANFKNGIPQPGAWERLLGKPTADVLATMMKYGPMAIRAPANAAMVVPRGMDPKAGRVPYPDHIGATPSSETLARFGGATRDPFNAEVMSGEVPYWAKQQPANGNGPLDNLMLRQLGLAPDELLTAGAKHHPELDAPGSYFTNPAGGRMQQALENDGTPPRFKLETSPDMVQRYLDALQKTPRQPPKLSVIEGGLPPPKGPYEP